MLSDDTFFGVKSLWPGEKEATATATAVVVFVVTRNQKSTHTPLTGVRNTFNSSCLDLIRDVITQHVTLVRFRTPARLESGNKSSPCLKHPKP